MNTNILQRLCVLQRSVSALMDNPLKEKESSANYYLTMHCLMLFLFLLGLINKHFFDIFDIMREAWPMKSQNFRNPLSLGAILALAPGIPIFLFWRHLGKIGPRSGKVRARRNYMSITFFSSIAVNIPLIFVALELNLPEISLILGTLNFFLWAKWSVREYAKLA